MVTLWKPQSTSHAGSHWKGKRCDLVLYLSGVERALARDPPPRDTRGRRLQKCGGRCSITLTSMSGLVEPYTQSPTGRHWFDASYMCVHSTVVHTHVRHAHDNPALLRRRCASKKKRARGQLLSSPRVMLLHNIANKLPPLVSQDPLFTAEMGHCLVNFAQHCVPPSWTACVS